MTTQNKVLIIDDEPAIRDLLEAWFSGYNFIADKAENPETAIELISLNEYSIIVVDFTMPVMRGSDFIEGIRDLTGKAEIIGMSAQPYVKNIFLKAGADYFVEKPIDFKRLASIIKRLHLINGSPEE